MRLLMILLVGVFLVGPVYGQQEPEGLDQEMRLSRTITKADLLLLDQMHKPPAILLQRALKIAERLIKKEKIDTSSCYLFQGKLLFSAPPQEPNWQFWWICSNGVGKRLEDIRIDVSMRGIASRRN